MPRLLFSKQGDAVWISHLDLMRVFQRAFKRAGLALTHTHGFNPRPSVSIALPLSVGTCSKCELLDFDLDSGSDISNEEIVSRLNNALIPGVCVLECYDNGMKIKELSLLQCAIHLEYDREIGQNEVGQIRDLFQCTVLNVVKKSKNGPIEQNIIPMIRKMDIQYQNPHEVKINAVICCQNPSLNPMQIVSAISEYLPHCRPDFAKCERMEIFDTNGNLFR